MSAWIKDRMDVSYREGEFQEAVEHVLQTAHQNKATMSLREAQKIVRELIQELQNPAITGTCSYGIYAMADEVAYGDKERIVELFFVPITDNKRWRKYKAKKEG